MIPVLVKDILPNPALQKYVRKYQVFRFVFDKEIVPPIKHHYPRPEHCITFYIRDTQKFKYQNPDAIQPYPQCIINGMHTTPVHRHAGNDFLALKIVLRPTALFQLLRFPINELTNTFLNAEDIWGKEVGSVCDYLKELDDLSEMITVVENFIESRIRNIKSDYQPIDEVSDWIIDKENNVTINWLFIAVSCNYYDYQHMAKDFKEFSNLTPHSLYELELNAPERSFGFSYLT